MAAHRNPVKRQQKRFPTRPFFLTGVWNSSYCLQKPAFILSPVLPDQFLFRLLLKMLRQWFCFFLFLPNQRGIISHCIIRAASPIEQVFFPGQLFSLLPHICALHIQCIILPIIFPLQIWGNSQDFPSYLWILPYSLNPIYQDAHGLDHDFLFLWTQVQDTGNHLVGGIFLYSRLPSQ